MTSYWRGNGGVNCKRNQTLDTNHKLKLSRGGQITDQEEVQIRARESTMAKRVKAAEAAEGQDYRNFWNLSSESARSNPYILALRWFKLA